MRRNNGLNSGSVHKVRAVKFLKPSEWFKQGMRRSTRSVLGRLHQTRQKLLKDKAHAYIDYSS